MSHIPIDKLQVKPSRTQQHFKTECEITNIMRRYRSTGILGDPTKLPHVQAQFADLANRPDYIEAFSFVLSAHDLFRQLPANIRQKFNGDPQELVAWLGDEKNREEAQKLGLLQPTPLTPPERVILGEIRDAILDQQQPDHQNNPTPRPKKERVKQSDQ